MAPAATQTHVIRVHDVATRRWPPTQSKIYFLVFAHLHSGRREEFYFRQLFSSSDEVWRQWAVWPVKSRQMSKKSCPKMISLEKLKILTTLQKLPKNVEDFGQINSCQRLWKVAQSAINHPIWSHCQWVVTREGRPILFLSGDIFPKLKARCLHIRRTLCEWHLAFFSIGKDLIMQDLS